MRQTGRTTRIVQYVVEQLYNVGTCIATDHTVYERESHSTILNHLEDMVKREMEVGSNGYASAKSTRITVDGKPYAKFEIIYER